MQAQYTDQARVEAFLGRALTASELVLLDVSIDSVSKFIEDYTSRQWNSLVVSDPPTPLGVTSRFYPGNGEHDVYVDEFTDLEKVEFLDYQGSVYLTLDSDSDFVLTPQNRDVKSSIFIRNYRIPNGEARIKVSAKFSSGVAPAGIIAVATELASKWLSASSQRASNIKSENIEGYSYTLKDEVSNDPASQQCILLLDGFKRIIL